MPLCGHELQTTGGLRVGEEGEGSGEKGKEGTGENWRGDRETVLKLKKIGVLKYSNR